MKTYFKKIVLLLLMVTGYITKAQTSQCFQQVSGGVFHSLAIAQNGTLWAWGDNLYGCLGDGTNINKNTPVQIGTATNWSKISAGQEFSLAIKTDGTLWAWGINNYSVLGNNSASPLNVPTQVGTATDWAEVSAGVSKAVAIKTNGTLWAWGSNSNNELVSTVTANIIQVPTQVGTSANWSKIDIGSGHILAIKTNGSLWAWGFNIYGEIGTGLTTQAVVSVPTQVGTATNWSTISAGVLQSLAVKTDGTLWAWGFNERGQVGDGTLIDKNVPTQIGTATNWNRVSSGAGHSLAQKNNGTFWAWGYNNRGQLGDGTTISKNIPTQVGTGSSWNVISAGSFHSFSIKADGSLWAMGWNNYGQIGNGGTGIETVPVGVACPTSLSADNFEKNPRQIIAYPNPVNDILKIESTSTIDFISIINLLGQEILNFKTTTSKSEIDFSNFQKGVYFVKVISENKEKVMKVIKK